MDISISRKGIQGKGRKSIMVVRQRPDGRSLAHLLKISDYEPATSG